MMFWEVFGILILGAIAMFGVWLLVRKLIGWLNRRWGFLSLATPGEVSLLLIFVLVVLFFIAGAIVATGEKVVR